MECGVLCPMNIIRGGTWVRLARAGLTCSSSVASCATASTLYRVAGTRLLCTLWPALQCSTYIT